MDQLISGKIDSIMNQNHIYPHLGLFGPSSCVDRFLRKETVFPEGLGMKLYHMPSLFTSLAKLSYSLQYCIGLTAEVSYTIDKALARYHRLLNRVEKPTGRI